MTGSSEPDRTCPTKVAVCAITFRRPAGLLRLLEALEVQTVLDGSAVDMTVVIVDNDADASAEPVVKSRPWRFELNYCVEPRQGIPMARNRALDMVPPEASAVCFIDDDEWPAPHWLQALVMKWTGTTADCIYGPVEPVFPPDAPKHFVSSRVFERRQFADGQRLDFAATNNVLIGADFLRQSTIRFNEQMRFTGGTDYVFFREALREGLEVRWSDDALVYEEVPLNRMTWGWFVRRNFRLGNGFALADRLEGTRAWRLRRLSYGLARIGLGTIITPAIIVSPYWGMRGLTHLFRGAGAAAGVFGHGYEEYSPSRLASAASD